MEAFRQQTSLRVVFLLIFVLALCNASPMSSLDRNMKIHLCGQRLADALSTVCGGYYSKKRSEIPPLFENDIFKYKGEKESSGDTEWFLLPNALKRSHSRGLHDECCMVPCSFRTLESYCSPY